MSRFNDTYETSEEAMICNFFGCSLKEFKALTEDDIVELYYPCLLALEPYD